MRKLWGLGEDCDGVSGRTGWQRVARRIRVPMGFGFAAVYLWLARPEWRTLAASLLLVGPGVWLRGYASGYVKKNAELATTGPYAHTRNPLYLGSMLIAFGFAVGAGGSWVSFGVIAGLLAGLFAAIYVPTILGEEAYLREHFAGFEAYARGVPRLLPRLTAARFGEGERGGFSGALYRKHREYNCAFGAAAIYAALILLMFVRHR
jgi:protein-S-isoprenylcysteine O-methyltransferase Ste14